MARASHWAATFCAYLLLLLLILSVKVRVVYIIIWVILRLETCRGRRGVVPHIGSRAAKARARIAELASRYSADLLSIERCLMILCMLLKRKLRGYLLELSQVLLMQSDSWRYGWRVLHAQVLLMLAHQHLIRLHDTAVLQSSTLSE